jgi:CrcB protein
MSVLIVALGAAVGGPLRYAIDQYFHKFTAKPVGIFLVNTLGSFFIGFTYVNSKHLHDLFAIGFAGAFTTWSTFIIDIYLAWELKRYKDALINLFGSLIVGLFAAYLGILLAS